MTLYLCAVKTITLSDNNMFTRFDASKSTKGASKLRRDLINAEIANLRDLLPLPPSTRQRLSQLQLMALVCVYVRKANYFQQAFKRLDMGVQQMPIPNIGFSKALSGFLMMMTQNGKLLYISDNAAEYLGHSMEDLLIHGDSVYDIIDKQDHQAIQQELGRATSVGSVASSRGPPNVPLHSDPTHTITCDSRMFLCRMNVSRNARRQMRFGDQKVVLVSGHFLSFLPLCSRNEPVFLATCTPIAMPETRECVVQGATNVFTSIHSMDMKFMHIDKNGEFYLEYSKCELQGTSWYRFLHWECLREAQAKHRSIIHNEQDRTCILLVRLQRRSSDWIWVHCVLQVKENMENSQQSVIVCTNQVLTEHEALVMNTNSWFYQYYMVQSKLQYSLAAYETHSSPRVLTYYQQDQKYTYMHNDGTQQQQHQQHGPSSAVDAQNNQYVHRNTFSQNTGDNINQHQLHHQNQRGHQQHQRPCSDAEPVDYSVHANNNEDVTTLRSSPSTSIASSKPVTIPLYSKRRLRRSSSFAPLDLEPLRINGSNITPTPTPILTDIEHPCLPSTSNGDIILVPAATAVPISSLSLQYALARSRLTMKSVGDPADCMEEWNPSPPWSDTLQKVPDITHHDLSSYSTTPPTPTSTPSVPRSTYMTFTFDWPPEQYVPSLNPSNVRHVSNPDTEESEETICEHYYNQNSHHSVASPASEEPWTRTMNSSAQMSPSKCSQDSV